MKKLLSLFLTFFILIQGFAQTAELRRKDFNVKKNIALEGYDPISYFEGKPTKGKEALKLSYEGIVYQFATQANLNKFKTKPSIYEPQYGGWCAYAMGESGEKVKVDPERTILEATCPSHFTAFSRWPSHRCTSGRSAWLSV